MADLSKMDIHNSEDIKLLVDTFYERTLKDEILSEIFKNHMSISLLDHLPIMYKFWDSLLLGINNYRGNPMLTHISLNKRFKLQLEHFNQWLLLWNNTIDDLFSGDNSKKAKEKALQMKELMIYKIKQSENNNFIQ